ncbi:AIM14 Probable metalloreductase AIM14 [Candida maltosa Xu316]|uniref:Probable metalloreductase AIM14 n=1 Tax=Candida maltosa (strain Xu316) TaxID=1245528 RepID=M3IWG6_CANMX|nr:hypothetical protein G210_4947 [Candida maltosa Xu316]
MDIEPRHGGENHTVNIKYGYIIFGLSGAYILLFSLINYTQIRLWEKNNRFSKFWNNLNHPKIWMVILGWFLIIFFIGGHKITEFSEQYTTVAKRYGRVAYCLVPLDIYLILRPSDVINLKSGYYLDNLKIHKWVSRLIGLCVLLHAIGFFYKWKSEGTLISKSFSFLNFLGVVVFVLFSVLVIVSIRSLRRRNYTVFYIIHNLTSWSMVVLIAFHARPGVTVFAIISLLLFIYQFYFLKFYKSFTVNSLKVIDTPISTMSIVKIPFPTNFPTNWFPGSHVRLNYASFSFKSLVLPSHPFTISSIPQQGTTNLTLIIKKTNNFQINSTDNYSLTGPFISLPPPFFTSAKSINIICGGSGISYGLPIFNHFKSFSTNFPIKLVWTVRNVHDLFIMNQLDLTDVQVFVTSIDGQNQQQQEEGGSGGAVPLFVVEDEEGHGLLHDDNDIPLQNMSAKKGDVKKEEENEEPKRGYSLGRPKFDEVFAEEDPHTEFEMNDKWMIACGSDALIQDSKKWARDKGYSFFYEKYEM